MSNRTRLLLAGWLVLIPSLSLAQSDWDAVERLPPGAHLRIELPAEVIDGRLRAADSSLLTVNGRAVRREDVLLVQRMQSRKAEGAAWGMLIGFTSGMVQSYLTAEDNKFVFGLYLGSGQAVLGALLGMALSSPKIETVYRR